MALQRGEKIDLNAATRADLELLPRIGPALAMRIVELRERRGRLVRVEDLLEVRGIGARTLERLRPYVQIAGQAKATEPVDARSGLPSRSQGSIGDRGAAPGQRPGGPVP